MRCEHAIEESVLPALLVGDTHKRFLQRDRAGRIVARQLHVLHSIVIGFEFLLATILHLRHLQTDARPRDRKSGGI